MNKEELIRKIAYNIYCARKENNWEGDEKSDWEMAKLEYEQVFGD
jgi:hypothetical protein